MEGDIKLKYVLDYCSGSEKISTYLDKSSLWDLHNFVNPSTDGRWSEESTVAVKTAPATVHGEVD